MARMGSTILTVLAMSGAACGKSAGPTDAANANPSATASTTAGDAAVAADPDAAMAAEAAPNAAQDAAEATKPSFYFGRVTLPSGLSMKLLVTVTGPGQATLDVPMQHLTGAALSDVAVSEREVQFSFSPPGAPAAALNRFKATREAGADPFAGSVEAGGASLPLRLWPATGPDALVAKRPQTPQPPFPYKTEELRLEVDGASLGCTLSLPPVAKPAPAVVFLTGSGAQDRDETIFDHKPFLVLADALARAGIASLRCDDRGVGQSSGDPQAVDADIFAADAVAMVKALRARVEVNPEQVGLLGHSEGGMTAAAVAKEKANRIPFVVTVAGPAETGKAVLVRQNKDLLVDQGVKADGVATVEKAVDTFFTAVVKSESPDALKQAARTFAEVVHGFLEGPEAATPVEEIAANFEGLAKLKWLRGFLAATPGADLAASPAAVLALFGEKDVQVRAPENAAALQAACSQAKKVDVTIVTVPGANHLFQDASTGALAEYDEIEQTMAPATIERIVSWIAERTQ